MKKVIVTIPPSVGGLSQDRATTTRSAPSKAAAVAVELLTLGVEPLFASSKISFCESLLNVIHLCLDLKICSFNK
jgi:hypothetical protein